MGFVGVRRGLSCPSPEPSICSSSREGREDLVPWRPPALGLVGSSRPTWAPVSGSASGEGTLLWATKTLSARALPQHSPRLRGMTMLVVGVALF